MPTSKTPRELLEEVIAATVELTIWNSIDKLLPPTIAAVIDKELDTRRKEARLRLFKAKETLLVLISAPKTH